MKILRDIQDWLEIIFLVFFPFILTFWAWGLLWLLVNTVLLLIMGDWIGGLEVKNHLFIGVVLLYTCIPTIALIKICSVNPQLHILPLIYFLFCALLIIWRK